MNTSIDIIFPNYNKVQFIRDCLNSLRDQTYTNWRCIVVDNCSDDGSWEIIEEFSQNDQRFELNRMPKPGIFYETWNFGLSKVKNPYFCLLTSDDIWENNQWLETAIKSLEKNPNAVAAAARTKVIGADPQNKNKAIFKSVCLPGEDTALFNSLGERFFKTDAKTAQLRKGLVSSIASYFIGPLYTSIHSLVMRSQFLSQGEKFAEDVGSTADYEWYIKMGLYGDIIYHPNITTSWRVYEGQATKHSDQERSASVLQKIHFRTRQEIAKKLDAKLASEFLSMAEYYDNHVFAYHYARPYLSNLWKQPLQEIPRFLKVGYNMPRELGLDFFYKIYGKNFFVEESLATANCFLNKMVDTMKK